MDSPTSLGHSAAPEGLSFEKRGHGIPDWWIKIIYAHGIMASIAWVILIPLGAILFRVLKGGKSFWAHTICQSIAVLSYLGAAGMGIWMAVKLKKFDSAHAILGLIILAFALLQPLLGTIHHILHLKNTSSSRPSTLSPTTTSSSSSRLSATETLTPRVPNSPSLSRTPTKTEKIIRSKTLPGLIHRYLGRITLTLAMVNGGLGLRLQGRATRAELIAYGVVAGVIWVGYFAVVLGTVGRVRKGESGKSLERDVGVEKGIEGEKKV